MEITAAFYDAANKVSEVACQAWATVAEYAGHTWTWIGTNVPAVPAAWEAICASVISAWNYVCATAVAAWAGVGPAAESFGNWVATYPVQVAVVAAIVAVAAFATHAISQRI